MTSVDRRLPRIPEPTSRRTHTPPVHSVSRPGGRVMGQYISDSSAAKPPPGRKVGVFSVPTPRTDSGCVAAGLEAEERMGRGGGARGRVVSTERPWPRSSDGSSVQWRHRDGVDTERPPTAEDGRSGTTGGATLSAGHRINGTRQRDSTGRARGGYREGRPGVAAPPCVLA